MADAATLYATESPYELRSLREQVNQYHTTLLVDLAKSEDWPDYKRRMGKLEATETILQMFDDMYKEKE